MRGVPMEQWAEFQARNGLYADGIPGPQTMAAVEGLEGEAVTRKHSISPGFRLSERSIRRMSGVHPDLKACAHYAIRVSPVDFGVTKTGGLRTAEMQAQLFEDGKSKKDGRNRMSRHQTGNALDVWPVNPENIRLQLLEIHGAFAKAAVELGVRLRWGGDWDEDGEWRDERFLDMSHHERPVSGSDWASQRAQQWLDAHGLVGT